MSSGALLDVNVLLALAWPQHIHHDRAQAWLAAYDGSWATTPLTEAALLRLSLNRAVTDTHVSPADAIALITAMRSHPGHRFLPDDSSLSASNIALTRFATGAQATDLHLVNLAAAHGLVLVTLDRAIPGMLDPADRRHVSVLEAR